MTSSDQSVPENRGASSNLQSSSLARRTHTATARLSMAPIATPRVSAFSALQTRAATSISTFDTPVQASSSPDHHSQPANTESLHVVPAPVTIKRNIPSDDDEDTKPPQAKRPYGWHPPLPAPPSDCSNRSRQRSILPSPPRRIRSRSPRARAIYEDYKPGLRLPSGVDQNTTANDWHDSFIQATRNAHIARIERLRAREELQEAIFELDLFQLEVAREKVGETREDD
ncbi:uncharacterized protein LDX57_010517 [Aspergillus melleus]|uniref:uncharacterized protein n=1 Tax=Aspergillus melleus TaxID=138277 RepID=UPI001E8E28A7|nr:uncharacterized protein LDX57_010517 [Aspergillus melleus]KAH8432884.1 hypothetical protein LDX57_010517 [Aspergillus melleus]